MDQDNLRLIASGLQRQGQIQQQRESNELARQNLEEQRRERQGERDRQQKETDRVFAQKWEESWENYPDCTPEFARAIDRVAHFCHDTPIAMTAPFANMTKTDIVRHGIELSVPFHHAWSC
ncbi:MAG: 7-cyano-7-deazaguanine synthase, partial [Planctomycetales bacterium]